jgi:hypothetical protein
MTSGWVVAAVIAVALLLMVAYGVACRVVEERALRRMRTTERDAAFIDARNLMVEYRLPNMNGGHAYRPLHGHSLRAGEQVRRHVCCWYQETSGTRSASVANWAAVYITDLRLLIRLSGGTQLSRGALVSVWWDKEPGFVPDLAAGRVTVTDSQGTEICLSGTQIALVIVACVYERSGESGLDQDPGLDLLRGPVPVRAR